MTESLHTDYAEVVSVVEGNFRIYTITGKGLDAGQKFEAFLVEGNNAALPVRGFADADGGFRFQIALQSKPGDLVRHYRGVVYTANGSKIIFFGIRPGDKTVLMPGPESSKKQNSEGNVEIDGIKVPSADDFCINEDGDIIVKLSGSTGPESCDDLTFTMFMCRFFPNILNPSAGMTPLCFPIIDGDGDYEVVFKIPNDGSFSQGDTYFVQIWFQGENASSSPHSYRGTWGNINAFDDCSSGDPCDGANC